MLKDVCDVKRQKKCSISKCSQDISGQVDNKLFLFALCFSLLSSFSTVSIYYLIYQKQNNNVLK